MSDIELSADEKLMQKVLYDLGGSTWEEDGRLYIMGKCGVTVFTADGWATWTRFNV